MISFGTGASTEKFDSPKDPCLNWAKNPVFALADP